MVTLSKQLKNAAQIAVKNNDERKALKNIYMDCCYIYATDGHLLYRGWHNLNLKKHTLVDLSDAKKGKLTLKEYQEKSEKHPDFNKLVPKYDSNHTINIKVSELLTAAESITTFLKDSDDRSCKLSFKRENGLISFNAWNNNNFMRLNIATDMNEVKSKDRFNMYIDPVLLVQALQGFNKKETILIDFYGPLEPFTIKDITGDQLYLIAPIRKF